MLLKDVVGQQAAVLKARGFIERFEPGKALMLYGPSGTGKTMIVRALAEEYGLELAEVDASDKRSAEAVGGLLSRVSKQASLKNRRKLILIDELEGLSAGDRGAVSAIAEAVRASPCPIIMTARNPYTQKLLPLRNLCELAEVKKLTAVAVEKHLAGLGCKDVKRFAARGDLRAAVIDFSTGAAGEREVQEGVFATVRSLFKAGSFEDARKAVERSEASPEELFWWVENNILNEFKKNGEVADAFDLLSRADLARRKGKMPNLLASLCSVRRRPDFAFVSYKPPMPYRRKEVAISGLHCSQKKARSDPFMKSFMG